MKDPRLGHRWESPLLLLSLLTTVAPLYGQSAPAARIRVDISGLRDASGQVSCGFFRSADGFPNDGEKAVAHQKVRITGAHATCNFEGIAPGQYAVAVFHDENGNGKMDKNLIGMPREGVGASNNAKGRFGPPKFTDAAFTVAGSDADLQITMLYL